MRPWRQFVRSHTEFDAWISRTKLAGCPRCGQYGTLIGHGYLRGYSDRDDSMVTRGRRLFCSNRHRRRGCGRTVSALAARHLGGFIVTTLTLAVLLVRLRAGATCAAAWRATGCALTLRSGYRLRQRLVDAQASLRTRLTRLRAPPVCPSPLPLDHMTDHLRATFPDSNDPLAELQLRFQGGAFD